MSSTSKSTETKPAGQTEEPLVSINLSMEESLRTEIRVLSAARGQTIKETVPYLLRLGLAAHSSNQPKK